MDNLTDLSEAAMPLGLPAENASLAPPLLSPHSGVALVAIVLVVSLVVLGTLVGNVLVVVAVFTSRALQAPQNLFLVSLALADILVATLVIPFSLANEVMGHWYFGRTWCSLYLALDVLFCTSSIVHLCAISLDRYWSVTAAVRYNRKRTPARVKTTIAAVWLISLVISSPPLLLPPGGEGPGAPPPRHQQCVLNNQTWYVLGSCLASFFAPGVVMVTVYCRIYRVAKQRAASVFVARGPSARGGPSRSDTCSGAGEGRPGGGGGYGPLSSTADSRSDGGARREADLQPAGGASSLQLPRRAGGGAGGGAEGGVEPGGAAGSSLKPPPPCRSLSWAPTDLCSHQLLPPPGRGASPCRARVAQLRERRFTLVLAVVMGAFLLCWFPFFFTYSLHAVCRTRCRIPDGLFNLFFWVGYCNSCLNPIIYTVFNRDFRRAFKKILFQPHKCT